MVILSVLSDIAIVFGWFGVFGWLGYSMVLFKEINSYKALENVNNESELKSRILHLWPKVMKFMYITGVGLCVVVCLPFYHSPAFTNTMVIIILACMFIGFIYLVWGLRQVKISPSRKAFRHCMFALYVSSGYAAGIIIMAIFNPIFGGQKFFI